MLPDPAQQQGQGRMPDVTPSDTSALGAADTTPEKAKTSASDLSSDDYLALAAGLLSNKSQYASEALGSGLSSLIAGRAARSKAAADIAASGSMAAYHQALADVMPSKAAMYEALADQKIGALANSQFAGQAKVLQSQLVIAQKMLAAAMPGSQQQMDAQSQMTRINSQIDDLKSKAGMMQQPTAVNASSPGITNLQVH